MGNRYGMEIRTALATDAAGIGDLLGAGGCPVPAALLPARIDALRFAHGTALLALEWGPPSGIVVLHWYPALTDALPVAQITTLLVGPDARRRGIGRQLLKAAAQAARAAGCGSLEVAIREDAPGLSLFCRATGFAERSGCFVRPLRKKP